MNKAHHFHQGRAALKPDSSATTDDSASASSRSPESTPARHTATQVFALSAAAAATQTAFAEMGDASVRGLCNARITPAETRVIEIRPVAVQPVPAATSAGVFHRAANFGLCALVLSLGLAHAAQAHADVSRAVAKTNGTNTRALHDSPSREISDALAMITGHGQLLSGMELHSPTRIAPSRSVWQQDDLGSTSATRSMTALDSGLMLTHFEPSNGEMPSFPARALPDAQTSAAPKIGVQKPHASTSRQASTRRAAKTSRRSIFNRVSRQHLMTTLALPPAFPIVARGQVNSKWTAPPMRRVRVIRPAIAPWAARLWAVTARSTDAPVSAALPSARIVAKKAAVRAQLINGNSAARSMPRRALAIGALPPADMMPRALPVAQSLLPDASQILPLRDAHGAPMRHIITVAQLKRLPPASQPLPAALRHSVIRLDDNMSTHAAASLAPTLPRLAAAPEDYRRAQTRYAQNPGAAPLRQPIRPVTSSDRLPNQLEVSVGTFVVLLTTSDLDTVAIAEPGVADVSVVNSRAVLVNGKTPGVTSLVIVDRFRIRQYQVRVVAAPGGLPRDILAQIALPGVGVRQVRDAIVLEGEVDSAEEVRRAVEIAGIYSPKVINQLTVRGVLSGDAALSTQIQSAINLPNVSVRLIGDTTVIDGTVETLAQRTRAQTVAEALSKVDAATKLPKVLNLIALPTLTVDQVRESLGNGTNAGGANANGANANGAIDGAAGGSTEDLGAGGAMSPMGTYGQGAIAPGISIRQVGDQVILEGFANDPASIAEAVAIATRTGFQVLNRVRVLPALGEDVTFRSSVEQAIGIPGVRVQGSKRVLIMTGTVADTNVSARAEQIARSYAGEVQNLLQTRHPILVNVDISIVEINRTNAQTLGIQVGSVALTGEVRTPATPTTPRNITRTIDPTFLPGQFLGGNGFVGLDNFQNLNPFRVRLDALITTGAARLLSNPRTTVLSGRLASFQVGGQVPIPAVSTVGSNGTTTGIVFKDFGVLIDVIPTANVDGVVTMRLRTEVSQPDFTNAVTPPGGGGPIPGFSRRSTTTEVTIQPGGTLALGGLIQNNIIKTISRVPILSRIPILGALFTSKRFQRNETELVIFVTPRVLPNPLTNALTAPVTVVAGIDNPGSPNFGTGAIRNAATSSPGGAATNAGNGAGNTTGTPTP